MITRKCNADNAPNTTDCVAVASQAANAYSRFTKCFYLLTHVIFSSRQQLTAQHIVKTCPGSHRCTSHNEIKTKTK